MMIATLAKGTSATKTRFARSVKGYSPTQLDPVLAEERLLLVVSNQCHVPQNPFADLR
jgi:hypothetical protein